MASRPSYQSIQCIPAGCALRHPDRSYHSPWIRTSSVVRQISSSQASIRTQFASSSQSHALEGSRFAEVPTDVETEVSPLVVMLDATPIRVVEVDAVTVLE